MSTTIDLFPAIPDVFKKYDNWVTYESAEKKAPKISGTFKNAMSDNPSTWVSYAALCENIRAGRGFQGIGFVPDAEHTGWLTCADIDNSVNGSIMPWAQELIDFLKGTYVERTVSGKGLRAWFVLRKPYHETFELGDKAKAHSNLTKAAQIEIVNDKQYMTFSSDVLQQSVKEVCELSDEGAKYLFELIAKFQKEYPASTTSTPTPKVANSFDFEPAKVYARETDGLLHKNRHHATVQEAGYAREHRFILLDECVRDQKLAPLNTQEWYDYITDWREKNVFDCHSAAQDEKVWSLAQWTMNLPSPTWLKLNMKVTGAEWAQHLAQQTAKQAAQPPQTQPVQPNTTAPTTQPITPELLDQEFPAFDGQIPPELPVLIADFLPEGNIFFGSLAGTIKTWASLSIAKALTTGMPLWGVFPVPEKVAVLYLIPEASDADFKLRLAKMGIPQDKKLFRFRTISQGTTRYLNDPLVVAMVEYLGTDGRKVLVIVDTAVRFMRGSDENASMENTLMRDSDGLRALSRKTGASVSILYDHHAPKAMANAEEMTLENVLRGSGDYGAMADAVYGFRRDDLTYSYGEGPEEVEVKCVKPRNLKRPPLPFRLALSRRANPGETVPDGRPTVSVIDETGDLGYISNFGVKTDVAAKLVAMVKENEAISLNTLIKESKTRKETVKTLLRSRGYQQVQKQQANGRNKLIWKYGLVMSSREKPVGEPEPAKPQTL